MYCICIMNTFFPGLNCRGNFKSRDISSSFHWLLKYDVTASHYWQVSTRDLTLRHSITSSATAQNLDAAPARYLDTTTLTHALQKYKIAPICTQFSQQNSTVRSYCAMIIEQIAKYIMLQLFLMKLMQYLLCSHLY